jgi:hypothetical protein
MSRLLAAVALVMCLAQSSGALSLLQIDFCAEPCPVGTQDGGCLPTSECCACCASPRSQVGEASPPVPQPSDTVRLSSADPHTLVLTDPNEVFHVPRVAAA